MHPLLLPYTHSLLLPYTHPLPCRTRILSYCRPPILSMAPFPVLHVSNPSAHPLPSSSSLHPCLLLPKRRNLAQPNGSDVRGGRAGGGGVAREGRCDRGAANSLRRPHPQHSRHAPRLLKP
eukprot:1970199-Rhodomonas_salina.3